MLEYYNSSENINDIGGLDALKYWLNLRKLAFSEKAREFGLPAPKGILLSGRSGLRKIALRQAVSALMASSAAKARHG